MTTQYEKIIRENLSQGFSRLSRDLAGQLGARPYHGGFRFQAFGEDCCVFPQEIRFSGEPSVGPRGLLVSLYVLHGREEEPRLRPFWAFKESPGSMPYQAAFRANTEQVLVPYTRAIRERKKAVKTAFDGFEGEDGDFSLVLYPLPNIALYYIFYLPDEDFPASATALFSANALAFMPLDGLADVAEYTSKKMITLLCLSG
ncbi:MAG: DUF3786 domain-containing protein [Deltaproteobacteria bacterium]|nr:DUF3786 domain-containing protein [Deltaproteobacteria bacterium]